MMMTKILLYLSLSIVSLNFSSEAAPDSRGRAPQEEDEENEELVARARRPGLGTGVDAE